MNQALLNQVLNFVVLAIIGYIGQAIVKTAPAVGKYLEEKAATSKGARLEKVALKIYYQVEEYFRTHPEVTREIKDKTQYFANLIRIKFPQITDEQIEFLRQSICGEINKDKPAVEEATKKIEIVLQPTYTAPDGTPLAPISSVQSVASNLGK